MRWVPVRFYEMDDIYILFFNMLIQNVHTRVCIKLECLKVLDQTWHLPSISYTCDSKLLTCKTLAMNGYMTSLATFDFYFFLLIGVHEISNHSLR